MGFILFENVLEKDKNRTIELLIDHSSPRQEFFLMVILAVSMAAFGLLLNSTIVLIGSMLIAPMLYSVLSISLGLVLSDELLIIRSIRAIVKSVILSIFASFLIGAFFPIHPKILLEISQTIANQNLLFMSAIVASIAGFAATYSLVKPRLNEALPGVAISTSLIPPLAAIGIGFSTFNWKVVSGALLLFIINVVGITLSSLIVFSILDFYTKKKIVERAVIKDEKEVEKENMNE